jgi:hypothetical protein
MAKGIQISSPVMKYFFKLAGRDYLVARAGTGTALAGGRIVALGFGLALGTALEISLVPAATLELEAWRSQLLGEGFRLALWTGRQWRIGHLLHDVLLKAATAAAISVDGHRSLRENNGL